VRWSLTATFCPIRPGQHRSFCHREIGQRTHRPDHLAEDLPITIEIVDSRDKVDQFLTFIEQQIRSGLVTTLQAVEIRTFERRASQ
jgi:PII-like signaling protein